MPHRKRRANGSSGRSQRRSSPAEFPPQTRPSPQAHARSAHANEFDRLRYRHSTFLGPGAPFQQRPRAQSVSGNATAFKASLHSNPYFASRCRTLKTQTMSLKQKLEELIAYVEELQPEQSAMDWVAPAGTVIYVPVNVTRDNEAPRVSPAHPEVEGLKKSTSPGGSQDRKNTENRFTFWNATNSSGERGFENMRPQAQPGPTDRESSQYPETGDNCFASRNTTNSSGQRGFGQTQPHVQPGQTGGESSQYNNKSENSFGCGNRNATNPSGYTGFGQIHPQGQPGQTGGESSQYYNKTEKAFGSGNPVNLTGYTGFGSMHLQAQPAQTGQESSQYNNKAENSFGFGNRNATNPSVYTGFGGTQPQA